MDAPKAEYRWLGKSAPKAPGPSVRTAQMQTVSTSPRDAGDRGPYRTVNRDQVLTATIAPPGARQQWQLYRVREESRDLELRSPIWGGYVRFARIQTLGWEPARLQFDRMTDEQRGRLVEAVRWIRREWRRFQTLPGVFGTGQTVHQGAGSALHHIDVDGDCFVTRRFVQSRRVWDLHPGDALAEASFRTGGMGRAQGNRQLGIEVDGYNRPTRFYFRNGGLIAPLNVEYSSFGRQGGGTPFPANKVIHLRDRSGEVTAVRGWPRCTTVVEDIARLDEWYSALVRSATLRASIGLALEREQAYGSPADLTGGSFAPGDFARSLGEGAASDGEAEAGRSRKAAYQEFAARSGMIWELEPGFKPHNVATGAPTAQEAQSIGMLERRVCAALRTTPATLLGDYAGLSFSGGQLGVIQERQAIRDRQMILSQQFYGPVFRDFLMARWVRLMGEHPELMPADLEALLYPTVRLKPYEILDKAKIIKSVLEGFAAGAMTYAEMRAELALSTDDIDEVISEWKSDRKKLGLPETPAQGGAKMPGDKDDGDEDEDKDEKDDDDADE